MPFENLVPIYKRELAKLQFISLNKIKVGLPVDFIGIEKDVIVVAPFRSSAGN